LVVLFLDAYNKMRRPRPMASVNQLTSVDGPPSLETLSYSSLPLFRRSVSATAIGITLLLLLNRLGLLISVLRTLDVPPVEPALHVLPQRTDANADLGETVVHLLLAGGAVGTPPGDLDRVQGVGHHGVAGHIDLAAVEGALRVAR
jgi:hypothetical protein